MTVTLVQAAAAVERAKHMCEVAEHDVEPVIAPCIAHVVEVSRAWWGKV